MKGLIEKYKLYGFKKFFQFSVYEIYSIWGQRINKSFSQTGEDVIIDKLLGNKKSGFYVDVGAYDPDRFSNTKRFYLKGWKGINVEPDVNNYEKFVKARKRDVNLNIGIGSSNDKLIFYRFFPNTLSTFADKAAKNYVKEGFRLIDRIKVNTQTLASVFEEHCRNRSIDFLSVDTEGLDLEVLKSNSWGKFRPKVISAETTIPSGMGGQRSEKIEDYLIKIGYKKYCDVGPNSIFVDQEKNK